MLKRFSFCACVWHHLVKEAISEILFPASCSCPWPAETADITSVCPTCKHRTYMTVGDGAAWVESTCIDGEELFALWKMQLVFKQKQIQHFNNSGGASGSQHCLPPGKQSFLDWYDLDLVPAWRSRPPLHPCCGAAAGQLLDICWDATVGIALKGAVAATFSQDTHSMYIYTCISFKGIHSD